MISRDSFRERPSCFAAVAAARQSAGRFEPVQALNWVLSWASVNPPMARPVFEAAEPSSAPAGYDVVTLGATPVSLVVGGHRGMFAGPTPLRDVVKMRRRILAVALGMNVGATLEPPWSWRKVHWLAPITLRTLVLRTCPASQIGVADEEL